MSSVLLRSFALFVTLGLVIPSDAQELKKLSPQDPEVAVEPAKSESTKSEGGSAPEPEQSAGEPFTIATEPDSDPDSPAPDGASSTKSNTAKAQNAQALRNENVFASKLDTETQKADVQRMGGAYVIVPQPVVESSYYASEFGSSASDLSVLRRSSVGRTWHGDMFESLQNSVFNARTFFQNGPVKPSRMNNYGFRFSGGLPRWGVISGSATQNKNRGMVNGNGLVPLPNERSPLATDPAVRAVVQRFINAFPNELPNRTDLDQRMLNTNAPQRSNTLDTSLRLDGSAGKRGAVSLSHSLNRQDLRAFQIIAGQNPDTILHSQQGRATYRFTASEATEFSIGANYYRVRSDLHPEPNAVGPRVRISQQVANLGPDAHFPLDRVENTFRYGGLGYHRLPGGRHRLTFGGDLYRYQLNGFEQNTSRGDVQFSNNFGRTAIENMLLGLPTNYQVRLGNFHRGFRTWNTDVFFADQWTVHPRFQIYWGVRHASMGAPVEVNRLDRVPYKSDSNNFSPRFAIAYQAPHDTVIRAGYTVSFGQIFPVTYSQIRYNPPGVVTVQVNNPSLVDPLADSDLTSAGARTSTTLFSPDLTTPYSHQYNFSIARNYGPLFLELGYLGSRTIKLINFYPMNRAEPVPGIPLTTATVNLRRPDQRYFDVVHIVNGGVGYLDAAQANWRLRSFGGLTLAGNYTFGKAIDQGSNYTITAANNDLNQRNQWQYEGLQDKKSLSSFDSPHAMTIFWTYALPKPDYAPRFSRAALKDWQISGAMVAKKGTPFNMGIGSDAPGFGNVDGGNGDRPHILDPSILGMTLGDPDTSPQILSHDKFRFLRPGELRGNLGFNVFRRQAIFNMNATVSREFKFEAQGQPFTLRFQGDAYNLTNHPQFANPENALSSQAFGKITNTLNNGRVLQFMLRLAF